jgi:hypothetical protein
MKILYPSTVASYGKSNNSSISNKKAQKGNSAPAQQNEKGLVYTKTYLGG